MGNRTIVAALASAALVAVVAVTGRAEAHTIGLSSGEYAAAGSAVTAKLAFARGEIAQIAPLVDVDGDGHVTAAELAGARPQVQARVVDRIRVSADGRPCAGRLTDAALSEQDGLLLEARWDCGRPVARAAVDVALLDDLGRGHRHVARAVGATTRDQVLYRGHVAFEVEGAAGAGGAVGADAAGDQERGGEPTGDASAWGFFKMGIEHILTGYDHLVFLLGLVLARARLRSLLAVVTAFTVAHSITLALAVLGVWAPSSAVVEPAIALSIGYVGVENFFVKDASKRWRITFPFGLIHGFGFAGALQEIALPPARVPMALVSFNLGVEAGQLAAMALVLPLVVLLRDRSWFERRGVRVLSGAVAVAGVIWFVGRVVG